MASTVQVPLREDPVLVDNCPPPVIAYPRDPALQALVTRGLRENRDRTLNLQIIGHDFYHLRTAIEAIVKRAAKHDQFMEVRKFILLWEKVNNQAIEQGF